MSALTSVVLIVCLLFMTSSSAAAQSASERDLKEIQNYKLTLAALEKIKNATRHMVTAMSADPRFQRAAKLQTELDAIEKKEEPTDADLERAEKLREEIDAIEDGVSFMGGNQSLDEIEAAARKEPLVANAFRSAGISAREYATFMAAYMQAALFEGFRKAGTIKELPKEANLDNIKFIQDHQKELEAFARDMEALGKKQP